MCAGSIVWGESLAPGSALRNRVVAFRSRWMALPLALAPWLCAPVAAQISPGSLSRPHQQLEGVTHCALCHDFGAGARGFSLRCLDCHTEIRRRLEAHTGFHSRAYKQAATQADCSRCHMEHNGQRFALTRLDRARFDHLAETGFALAGKHRGQACEACHNAKRIPPAARAEIKVKDPNRSFLGLNRDCAACHEDRHGGQLGSDCTHCHTEDAWKPAPGFDHSRTPFPLTGLHQAVACQKCHGPKAGEDKPRYKGLVAGTCQGCHEDPHHGGFLDAGFSGTCDSCHNTNGWKNARPAKGFNHSATKFPLTGKHAERPCADCHKSDDFRRPIAYERCGDCHQDPHAGQFAGRVAGSDCAACHFDSGFKPARFDRTMHEWSAFPLEGKHAALGCPKCHQPEGRSAVYRTGKLVCSACHADQHAGEFAAAPYFDRCEQCHTQAGFELVVFSVEHHEAARFPLTGRHALVPCSDCHKPLAAAANLAVPAEKIALPAVPRQHRFTDLTCNTCHQDPHQTRLACEECHTTQQWRGVKPFDHEMTGFRLEGAHQNVKCVDCHPPAPRVPAPPASAPGFSDARKQCGECHGAKDGHGGQFTSEARAEDCAACHVAVRWETVTFDHERALFTLDVAHRRVECAKCHKQESWPGGRMIRVYRGTPTQCVQCH